MKQSLNKIVCGFLLVASLISGMPVSAHAEEAEWPVAPEINGEAAILMEASTGTIIYNKNAYGTYFPASTTKLMTALLALEQCPLSDTVTCSYDSVHSIGWDSSRIGLDEGEQISMEDSLYAILLASANEVSYAVAEHIGGTIGNFASMMNERAAELGCVNTNFVNPHGLHNADHYTCPYDLALMAKKAIEYTTFRRISNSYYYKVPETNLNVARPIANTHQILRKKITYEGVFAGKTGHTSQAGYCLVTCAERNGLTLICVIMKSLDNTTVYDDTISLLDYGFNNFSLSTLKSTEVDSKNAFPSLFEDNEALISDVLSPLTIRETTLVLPNSASYDSLIKKITLTPVETLSAGENVIGEVAYYYADNFVGTADILFFSETDVVVSVSPTPTPSPVPTEEPSATDNPAAVPGDTQPTGTPSPTASVTPTAPTQGTPGQNSDFRPLIIGIITAVILLVIGFYLVLVEFPYRRRRREYYRRRRNNRR